MATTLTAQDEAAFQERLRMAQMASLAELDRARLEKQEALVLAEAQRASLEDGLRKGQEMAIEASRLSVKATALGLEEAEVARDGNCQFHAVAKSLVEVSGHDHITVDGREIPLDHIAVRGEAVAWLRAHSGFRLNEDDADTELCHYLHEDPSWEAYCNRMSREAQYGDHLTLIAMAERFSSFIVVVTSEAGGVNYHTRPRLSTPLDTIHLAHYPLAQHYNQLCLRGERDMDVAWSGVLGSTMHLGDHLTTGFAYKVHCPSGQLRRIRTEYNASQGRLRLGHDGLREHIARVCLMEADSLLLRWKDIDGGDLITFDTDEELLDAVRCTAAAGQKVLRIFVEAVEPGARPAQEAPLSPCGEWCMVEPPPPGEAEEAAAQEAAGDDPS